MIKKLTLKQSMQKNIQAIMPIDNQKYEFQLLLEKYIERLLKNKDESEEFQKNILADFLKNVLPYNFVNTSNRVDLAIYNGPSSESSLGVIIENKRLNNVNEMMSKDKINAKAFQEIISYYLYERLVKNNLEIKKCIITNGVSWFIIEAKEFEKYFIKNKKLIQLYDKWRNKQLSSFTTDFLYSEVISPAIDMAIEKGIAIAHFNLLDALECQAPVKLKESNITQLYRFYTSENLLNKEIFTDSNKLNKSFYDELLYIMGLEEKKENNTKIISRLPLHKREYGSLVESIISKLQQNDVEESIQEENAIKLSVIWMNRILFLKLLEAQLVLFNNDKTFKFLTYENIKSFGDLSDLFFGILAKKVDERDFRLAKKYSNIPYLNSSLFEETELELSREGITIDRLREEEIKVFNKTKLKNREGKKLTGNIDFHEYLFGFLDSYDFSAVASKNKDTKSDLINASVLGLIFEKINGYKEGSFFTPGNITMYMSRRALHDAIVSKVTKSLGWNVKTIEDVKFNIDNIEKAKKVEKIIDELKICDPAVGSGHFLVSMLNEIIFVKSYLRCLFDFENKILTEVNCYVANDELVIQNMNGDNFIYHKENQLSKRIQKSLFNEKRKIVENSLFGVDINDNSSNICRLRLWIELLKSSYYDDQNELTTLPNIDINIKTGDSLLYKFDLKDNFDMEKDEFKEYLDLVKIYKNTNNKVLKKQISENIQVIKDKFDKRITTPELKRLKHLKRKLEKTGQISLFENKLNEKDTKVFYETVNQINKIEKNIKESFDNPIYRKGLEWRMEFPEILDINGDFLGYDIIIGNPPYIFARNHSFTEKMDGYYKSKYNIQEYQTNTYTLFIELGYKLLKEGGIFSYIIPNNILTITNNVNTRKFLLENTRNLVIINSLEKIFKEASVDNCILFFEKGLSNHVQMLEYKSGDYHYIGKVETSHFGIEPIFSFSMVKYKSAIEAFWKIDKSPTLTANNIVNVTTGIKAYQVNKGKPKQTREMTENKIYHSEFKIDDSYIRYLDGKDVSRYDINWGGKWIKYGNCLAEPRYSVDFNKPRLLVRQIPTKSNYSLEASYIEEEFINDINSMIVNNFQIDPLYVLGIINSKPVSIWFIMKFDKFQRRIFPQFKINELSQFPLPIGSETQINNLVFYVKEILESHKKNDSSKVEFLNDAIDEIVMDIFDFNEEEKQSIRELEVF